MCPDNTLGTVAGLLEALQVPRINVTPRPHYDDSVLDPLTGAKSEWTLLIYLTGIEDGVEGGEVGPVQMTKLARNADIEHMTDAFL